jgi:hypothetical protein
MSPAGYELALKAYYNIGEWSDEYDELLYKNIADTAKNIK